MWWAFLSFLASLHYSCCDYGRASAIASEQFGKKLGLLPHPEGRSCPNSTDIIPVTVGAVPLQRSTLICTPAKRPSSAGPTTSSKSGAIPLPCVWDWCATMNSSSWTQMFYPTNGPNVEISMGKWQSTRSLGDCTLADRTADLALELARFKYCPSGIETELDSAGPQQID